MRIGVLRLQFRDPRDGSGSWGSLEVPRDEALMGIFGRTSAGPNPTETWLGKKPRTRASRSDGARWFVLMFSLLRPKTAL